MKNQEDTIQASFKNGSYGSSVIFMGYKSVRDTWLMART